MARIRRDPIYQLPPPLPPAFSPFKRSSGRDIGAVARAASAIGQSLSGSGFNARKGLAGLAARATWGVGVVSARSCECAAKYFLAAMIQPLATAPATALLLTPLLHVKKKKVSQTETPPPLAAMRADDTPTPTPRAVATEAGFNPSWLEF